VRRFALVWLSLVLLGGCEKQVPAPAPSAHPEPAANITPRATPAEATPALACMRELSAVPPAKATSRSDCPEDREGRPAMPTGTLRFPKTRAPELNVEIALTDAHKMHGLMFRPALSESEGMLFSWNQDEPRSFWMHNTCLALDMLFLDHDGYVVSILEQVPPWNDTPRPSGCAATHVLEVRAGWARDHGVLPGMRAELP
jgi:uncharacterized protein